jgi:hypothetical protein
MVVRHLYSLYACSSCRYPDFLLLCYFGVIINRQSLKPQRKVLQPGLRNH